jgi:hypothetical protein
MTMVKGPPGAEVEAGDFVNSRAAVIVTATVIVVRG